VQPRQPTSDRWVFENRTKDLEKRAALRLGAENIDWSTPPRWAADSPDNSRVDLKIAPQLGPSEAYQAYAGSGPNPAT